MPAQPFDLLAFINLQKAYASQLNGIPVAVSQDEISQSNHLLLSDKLTSLGASLDSSIAKSNELILQQDTVNHILQTEDDRLKLKTKNINDAITGQKRLILLNESYRKKYAAYIKIVLTVVFALLIIILLMFTKKFVPFIPEAVYTLLYIIILASSIIYGLLLFTDLQKHDQFDFDKIKRPDPVSKAVLDENAKKAAQSGNLLGSLSLNSYCFTSSCCADGTTWSPTVNKCLPTCPEGSTWNMETKKCVPNNTPPPPPKTTSPFTTLTQAYKEEKDFKKKVNPYTPNEFNSYSKLY
jgi:hypothetical protein